VVNLVKARFGFYHASVFLVDEESGFAVLRESTGEAGRQLKVAGHKLAVGSASIVGQATAQGKPIVANDVTRDATHSFNPLLPGTRAELAIPLRYGMKILGALDVQSQQANAFLSDDVNILQLLTDQLAVAIVNADLFTKTQRNLSQYQLLQQVTASVTTSSSLDDAMFSVMQGLNAIIAGVESEVYIYDSQREVLKRRAWFGEKGKEARTLEELTLGSGMVGLAAQEKSVFYSTLAQPNPSTSFSAPGLGVEIAIPLIFQNELLGVFHIFSTSIKKFNESDQEILGILATSLGAVITNTRLIEQIQNQVSRQQQIYEIANRIRRLPNMESILQTSASEIGRALGARRAHIEINIKDTRQPPGVGVLENPEEVNP
jgi:GAF domain-containing protein